ncbi:MAG: hypothetical protein EKK53_25260 [Burkholderiales bacterium]|nr:MAG: hypothetical protein EKK53_25260 [Burkholderiales bacterium]
MLVLVAWLTGPAHADRLLFSGGEPDVMAEVDWRRELNPEFVPLGHDRFLLATRTGTKLWDTATRSLEDVKNWPEGRYLDRESWARLGPHTLLSDVQRSPDGDGRSWYFRNRQLMLWNGELQRLEPGLELEGYRRVVALLALDSTRALVCLNKAPSPPVEAELRVLELSQGRMHWVDEMPADLRPLLRAARVQGQLLGETLAADAEVPIAFDLGRCAWTFTQLPKDRARFSKLHIKP